MAGGILFLVFLGLVSGLMAAAEDSSAWQDSNHLRNDHIIFPGIGSTDTGTGTFRRWHKQHTSSGWWHPDEKPEWAKKHENGERALIREDWRASFIMHGFSFPSHFFPFDSIHHQGITDVLGAALCYLSPFWRARCLEQDLVV